MFHEIITIMVGAAAAFGAFLAVHYSRKHFKHATRQFEPIERNQTNEKTIHNGTQEPILDLDREGELQKLTVAVYDSDRFRGQFNKIIILFVIDNNKIEKTMQELIFSNEATESKTYSYGRTVLVANYTPQYYFHKKAQIILENQTNQTFGTTWHIKAKCIKN